MSNQITDTWYEDFFQGINCELWENAIPAEFTKQEVAFLLSELNLQQGQHILDIPCGFGRHAVEISKKGYAVTGIDISETFIHKLREKILAEKLPITAIQANILSVQLTQKFSGAVCLGNSFGYFNIESMKLFVAKVAASLEPGAKFIINSGMIAECILPNFQHYATNNTYTVGNITMEVSNVYNVHDGYMCSHLLYTKEGKTETHAFKHYVFTLSEIVRLLQWYGLTTIATYSSTLKVAYKPGDRQVYIVAEKH